MPTLQSLFLREGGHIHTLRFQPRPALMETMFKNKSFPSLRRVFYSPMDGLVWGATLGLLSLFNASEISSVDVLNQLAPVFTCIPELTLHIDSTDILQFVLDMLHNNAELRSLTFIPDTYNATPTSRHQIILSGLQCLSIPDISLLEYLQVPKLSTFIVRSRSPVTIDNPIIQSTKSLIYLQSNICKSVATTTR
ncbi:hypothetical protein Clacol_010318 [Clathrus columnatus]|uniref:Uncharacterized protein n=1 Tax=Clathrus columnatus TaxID=1419009 RepID=A0AAV5ASA9_9AGAM|nr:hypothetical protein Clacol_010318 [Clathrus columnatus]